MTMTIPHGIAVANLYSILPRGLRRLAFTSPYAARITSLSWSSMLPSASVTIPALTLNIPDIVSGIWDGILRAVPKKKTSHMKKRHRQLAGKALKDVKSLVRCPACGKPKKAHILCPYCVAEIQSSWRGPADQEQIARLDNEDVMENETAGQEKRFDSNGRPKVQCNHCEKLISQRNWRRHVQAKHPEAPSGERDGCIDGAERHKEELRMTP